MNNLIGSISYNYENVRNRELWELKEYKNPIFFLSLFEPSFIHLRDYYYSPYILEGYTGHIFALFSPPSNVKFILAENSYEKHQPKIKVIIGKDIEKVHLISKSKNAKYKSGLLIEYSQGSYCLFNRNKRFKSYIYLKCSKYQASFPKIIDLYDYVCTYLFEWDTPYACKNCVTKEIEYYEETKCKNCIRNYLFYSNEECSIFNSSKDYLVGNNISFNDKSINFEDDLLQKLFFGNNKKMRGMEINENNNKKIINIKNEKQIKKFKFDFIENEIYKEECYFFEDFSKRLVIIILIIIGLYLLVIIFTILYCCKYKK